MNELINIDNLPDVFESREIIKSSKGRISKRMLSYAITRFLERKELIRIKNGTYSKTGDVFYIACRLFKGYIGLSSALYLFGLKSEVENIVYICTSSNKKKLQILDKIIEPVNMSKQQYGTSILKQGGRDLLVSTYAKTVFDMLSKPAYANYFDMYRALRIRPFAKDEWPELLYYAKNSSITNIRRVGYAMDGIAPASFTNSLERLSDNGYKTSYFFKHKYRNYSSKWNMYDDLHMKKWSNAI